jgi:hypothetical protein
VTVSIPTEAGRLQWVGRDCAGQERRLTVGNMTVDVPNWAYDWTDPRARREPEHVTVQATFQAIIPTPEWDEITGASSTRPETVASVFLDATKRATIATLADRLRTAAASLDDMLPVQDTEETARLSGKAEGVRLALSYVEEHLRERAT